MPLMSHISKMIFPVIGKGEKGFITYPSMRQQENADIYRRKKEREKLNL